jgi:hypothetical protein
LSSAHGQPKAFTLSPHFAVKEEAVGCKEGPSGATSTPRNLARVKLLFTFYLAGGELMNLFFYVLSSEE